MTKHSPRTAVRLARFVFDAELKNHIRNWPGSMQRKHSRARKRLAGRTRRMKLSIANREFEE